MTTVQNMYQMMLRMFFRAPLQFVCAMFLSFRLNPTVGDVFLVVIPLILVTLAIFGPIAMRRFKKMLRMFDGFERLGAGKPDRHPRGQGVRARGL